MKIPRLLTSKNLKPLVVFGTTATVIALVIIAFVSWVLYQQTSGILESNLRERLLSIVRTGAVEFNAEDIKELQVEQDWTKPAWQRVVHQMEKIRKNNPDILFAYMFRIAKSDPKSLEFVADSHSINPYVNVDGDPTNDVDLNQDGIIDDSDQLQWPGQPFPSGDEVAFNAYQGPTTSQLYQDQWGHVLTGYVPIKDANENVVAIFAVDILANDFASITRETLTPFLLFSVLLFLIIMALSVGLFQVGRSRIDLLQEIDEQKNQVISIVAHQLNTPITTVKWAVELLRDGSQTKDESANQIEGGVKQLGVLSDMFLQASHIQKGKLEITTSSVELGEFYKSILDEITILAQKKKINLRISMPPSLPTVLLDPKYLRVTIENLLTNAVKYTPEGGNVDFTLDIKNQTMYCTIKDTGIGIPKKDQEKVFGQMYRASNVSKPKSEGGIEGNGLGLYAAKGSIEAQGGKIRFESEEGKGTTFFVELPLKFPVSENSKK